MKKTTIIVVVAVVIITVIGGCLALIFIPHGEWFYHGAIGSNAVPGMSGHDSYKIDTEVIEKDEYGRIMILYKTYSGITEKNESAVVICQKYDKNKFYIYEDKCYIIGKYTDNDIEELKTANDWGEKIDLSKASTRNIKFSLNNHIIRDSCFDIQVPKDLFGYIERKIGLEDGEVKYSDLDLTDCNGKANLYVLRTRDQQAPEVYFVIASKSKNGEGYDISFMKITDKYDFARELHAFKTENGWYTER